MQRNTAENCKTECTVTTDNVNTQLNACVKIVFVFLLFSLDS